MMRYKLRFLLVFIVVFGGLTVKAQTSIGGLPVGVSPVQTFIFPDYQSIQENRFTNQKWFVSRYAAISTGNIFYPGASAFFFSAPIGMQLNRRLTNNLYAFAGAYVAPTFTNFNHSFLNSPNGQSYPGANQFTVNPGIQMGLMYVNDAGTFSVSGSIRAEYSNSPNYIIPQPPRTQTRK